MVIFKGKIRTRNSGGTYDYLLPETTIDMVNGLQVELDNKVSELELEKITKVITSDMSNSQIQNIVSSGGHIRFEEGIYELPFLTDKSMPYCLDLVSNTDITIHPNAILKCAPTSSGRYCMFMIDKKSNINITGGKLLGDRDIHIGTSGEWGFGININGSENVYINNTHISNFWGDGIYIGSFLDNSDPNFLPKNIHLNNVICDNNRRQGMSIVAVDGLYIKDSTFSNTNGTLPSAGVDIEPNEGQIVRNVFIDSCLIFGNEEEGILVTFRQALINTIIDNVIITKTAVYDNKIGIRTSNLSNKAISIDSCYCHSNERGIALGITSNADVKNNIVRNNEIFGISISTDSNYNNIIGNEISRNIGVGINILQSSNNIIQSNIVSFNGTHGINCITSSTNNNISNNSVLSNGLSANDTYSNIKLESSTRTNLIQGNIIRRGSESNRVKYGIYFAGNTANNNVVINNDCFQSGISNSIFSPDSANISGSGNRINDGTWSTNLT